MTDFFTQEEGNRIIAAIQAAELNTSGEIRVHLEDNCKGPIFEAATKTFRKLKMHKTKARNGILFFLAPERKEFAIIGDEGINKVVPENYWDDVRDILQSHFRKGEFADGICKGVELVGEKLQTYFPYQSDDVNELSDDISFGDGDK